MLARKTVRASLGWQAEACPTNAQGGALCHRYFFDAHAGDAIAVHFQDGEAAPLVFDRSAGLGNVTQAEEEEPGQGLETGVGRNFDAVLAVQLADANGAVQ